MFFMKKPKPKPTRQQLAAELRARLAEATGEAMDAGLTIHDTVRELNLRVELLRNAWACSAPLGQRCP